VTFTDTATGTTVDILSSGQSQNNTQSTTSLQVTPWRWGTLEPGSVAGAVSSPTSPITGQTSWGQPFHIECPYGGDEKTLACFMDGPPTQVPWNAVALGTIVGTLIGAAVGFFVRSPGVGALAGFVGAAAGSTVAARAGLTGVATSTPTWVANDGQGGRLGKPGPHRSLKSVSA
jgi:hypothetical protein